MARLRHGAELFLQRIDRAVYFRPETYSVDLILLPKILQAVYDRLRLHAALQPGDLLFDLLPGCFGLRCRFVRESLPGHCDGPFFQELRHDLLRLILCVYLCRIQNVLIVFLRQ